MGVRTPAHPFPSIPIFRLLSAGFSPNQMRSTLFVVFPRQADPGRVAAVFLPLSPSAAAAVGRKIPHYGKYGYLVFTDGENKSKGTWEPADSPVVHRFKAKELD